MILVFALIGIIAYLFIPFLIVGLWKKRPRTAFAIAMLILFLTMIAPAFIQIFQAMMVYGEGDPQLMAGQLSRAILGGLFGLALLGPILFLFQWLVLRRHKKKLSKVDVNKTFS